MNLGTSSLSLSVADLAASRAFYEQLGFEHIDGDDATFAILRNDNTKIGLFHGLFDGNALTFNPTDVRAIQRSLKDAGITFTLEADETTTGPAHAMLIDPDGNAILLDQH